MSLVALTITVLLFLPQWADAQTLEEELLTTVSGERIDSQEQWESVRRPELLRMFRERMYGQAPPPSLQYRLVESEEAFGGLAVRKQFRLTFRKHPTRSPTGRVEANADADAEADAPIVDLLVYLPTAAQPTPVILGINFWGNHAITKDTKVFLSRSYMESKQNPWCELGCVQNHRATEACRGINASQWPVEKILARGYGLATFYRNDLECDDPNRFEGGIRSQYPQLQERGDNFSTIGAWAWGLQRGVDVLTSDPDVDAKRIAVFGWSRLGKAALWAAANDPRIALTLSNEAGAGGAKLFRRKVGEDIERLNTHFPHWYCDNFKQYNQKDEQLPFDMHQMLALLAPRPFCLGGAEEDQHADPEGEFLALKAAGAVYRRLYGLDTLPAKEMLELRGRQHTRSFGRLGYHYRAGKHEVLASDWDAYLDFTDRHFRPGHNK